MDKLEKLAQEIYKECLADGEEVTEQEALEMAKMELGAKEIKNYTQGEKPKEKKKREVKLDPQKVEIIKEIFEILPDCDLDLCDLEITNPQKEITFKIEDDEYSLSLIKHRPAKK